MTTEELRSTTKLVYAATGFVGVVGIIALLGLWIVPRPWFPPGARSDRLVDSCLRAISVAKPLPTICETILVEKEQGK